MGEGHLLESVQDTYCFRYVDNERLSLEIRENLGRGRPPELQNEVNRFSFGPGPPKFFFPDVRKPWRSQYRKDFKWLGLSAEFFASLWRQVAN